MEPIDIKKRIKNNAEKLALKKYGNCNWWRVLKHDIFPAIGIRVCFATLNPKDKRADNPNVYDKTREKMEKILDQIEHELSCCKPITPDKFTSEAL